MQSIITVSSMIAVDQRNSTNRMRNRPYAMASMLFDKFAFFEWVLSSFMSYKPNDVVLEIL